MDFASRMRNAFINSTRGYFAMASDVIVSDYDVPYYDGEEFFDRKHRLNVHYHATLPRLTATDTSGLTNSTAAAEILDEATEPPAPKMLPVVVFIHGGGWKRGDRNYMFDTYNNFGKAIASEGFVVVVPSYRLSMAADGGVQHPKHAHDIAYVLRWVKDNIGRYNGDADMVFLSGHSAGGHLATLLALDVRYMEAVGLEPEFIKGVVGICGVYDLVTGYNRFLLRNLFLIDAFGHDQDVLREASPVHHARSNAPPFMLFNASMDFGLEDDSLRLRAELVAHKGNSVAHRSFAGTNHGSIIGLGAAWGKPYPPLVRETCAWLKTQVAAIHRQQQREEECEEAKKDVSVADLHQEEGGTDDEGDDSGHEAGAAARAEAQFLVPDATSSPAEAEAKPVMVLRAYGWE